MLLKMWIFFILILTTGAVEPDQDELHKNTLVKLAKDFKSLPIGKQYGVMYMHPPKVDFGIVVYSTDLPNVANKKGNVTVPHLTEENRNNFQFSYVATTPDYKGAMYSSMMNSPKGKTLHTEDLMLNLVYNGMKNWYKTKFGEDVQHVYLFTYYLPCPECSVLIQTFVNENPSVHLYVGFLQLLGGNREYEYANLAKQRVKESRARKATLMNFLNNKNGKLYDLKSKCKRRKRSPNETCSLNENMTELSLAMDFGTGRARVNFVNLPNSSDSWIGLYDNDNVRIEKQYVTNSTGTITFNSQMNELYYAQYSKDNRSMYLDTGKWKQCGFGWTTLNKLPCNYGILRLRVQIQDGVPYVCLLHSGDGIPNSNDWLMVQPLVNFSSSVRGSNWKQVYDFVSNGRNVICHKFAKLDNTFEEGFRVKYVYNNATDQYEGPYDNSSPVWIPDECAVASSRESEQQITNSASGTTSPANGTNRTEASVLVLWALVFSILKTY